MSLYICLNCGHTFDVPDHTTYGGETWSACPHCGSDDYVTTSKCRGCGADVEHGDLIAGYYCADCVDAALENPKLVERYMSFDDVRENFAEFLAEMNWKKVNLLWLN